MSTMTNSLVIFRERMRAALVTCGDELHKNIEEMCKDIARSLYEEGVESASVLECSLGGENNVDINTRDLPNSKLTDFGVETYAVFQINTRELLEIRTVINSILKKIEEQGYKIRENVEVAGTLRVKFGF